LNKKSSSNVQNKNKILNDAMRRKILEEIIISEPNGKRLSQISYIQNVKNVDKDKVRQKVGRYCKKLEKKDFIYKENKQAKYHVTEKIYGYPKLTGFLFSSRALKSIRNTPTNWICTTNKFCNNELCKKILGKISSPESNNDAFYTKCYNQITLFELGLRLSAFIEYIMIQAVRPKKLQLIYLDDVHIKGLDKNKISHNWIDHIEYVREMFVEFCRLWVVKRGLAVFADKGKTPYMDPSFPLEIQNKLIAKRKKMRQMDTDDPYWSHYEMDEENYTALIDAFKETFPDSFNEFEKLREGLLDEIEGNMKMAKEEKKRITQLEKDDPDHVKCNGKLVPDFRYKCSKCGRRLLKS
jgi:hypothetical protein